MKAKITKGKNFKTIINYVFSPGEKNKKDRAQWIGGTLASDNPDGLIKEFAVVQSLKPNIKNPSWHCSLTLSKGEYLSKNQWSDVVVDFMDKMKFDKYTPYAIIRHNDTEYDHVHIVASKIPMVGPVWRDSQDVYRAIAATQELEEKYNLTRTPGYSKRESARETYRERKKAERTGVTPPRIQLQELIDRAVADRPTATQLAQRLEDAGVTVRANIASTGKMNGFSFELDGLAFKGSKLGKAYGWSGLQKRGVSYDVERDAAELERYRLPVAERPPHTDETLPEPSRSNQIVETSPELEADTDSISPEPRAEKVLRALEGYYQSQVDNNEETLETSPQQDFVENNSTETAPTTRDTDTDFIEAARLEAAINAVEEIFNQSVEQGKSRALSEEFSSESSLLIEDIAQQNSTEASPEATQPPVDKCALSKLLTTEAAPEMTQPETTQPPIESSALSEVLK
ncbi:MAG: relaxase/mobilization nuclease domain-containing protein [Okeania sp. SIO2C2]|uniref:relaxase/mobilization nuclease domain-containing protein n=1 Tax=Okeania sp. SIO2C2 TaxID=2607787 RepID=UPI0013B9326A|nr:relaxase/mobilization nuclease domain-containing protein [Okeania sp. SIO2C2]NEP91386.1 relaxase/mobilization nuclease domain-containing protein [Okeania sp. SIO2C2]